MRRLFATLALVSTLALGGCAGTPLGEALRVATTEYKNPLGPVAIYRAKLVFDATRELVVAYREYCWKQPYEDLMKDPIAGPVCKSRRPVVRSMQRADEKAELAIVTASNFVRQNPKVNATNLIAAAVAAANSFKDLAGKYAAAALK